MIAAKTLAEAIEQGLNNNTLGIKFAIHSDVANYKKAINTRFEKQRFTNGILKIISSSVVPIQDIIVATQTAQLDIAVQLPCPETVEETAQKHRAILDGYFQTTSLQVLSDESGKKYSIGSQYSLATTGGIEATSPLGPHIVFTVMVNYSFVQNGVNSSQFGASLDGVEIGYTDLTVSRVATMDASAYSGADGNAKNIPTTSALTFEFQLPKTDKENAANAAIGAFLFSGALTTTHSLQIRTPEKNYDYVVSFGEANVSIEGIKNAGYTVTLVESAPIIGEGYGT